MPQKGDTAAFKGKRSPERGGRKMTKGSSDRRGKGRSRVSNLRAEGEESSKGGRIRSK